MYAISLLLSLYIHTLCGPSYGAESQAVPSVQLLPDGFLALGDYEILSAHEEGDEDIVHIRKRNDEDCEESDCWTYSAWSEDRLLERCNEGDDAPDKRSLLKRGRKPIKEDDACKGIKGPNGQTMPGFHLISPTYPQPPELEKTQKNNNAKRVYDTGDPRKPEVSKWFELQLSDERWKDDVVGKKPKPERCYDSEHVLEWHLLKEFLQQDMADGPKSRCYRMYQYYLDLLPTQSTFKVQAAKNNGKLDNNGRFTLEDKQLDFSKWNVKVFGAPSKPRMIDYISHQWPGTTGGTPNNPWEFEMVLLNHEANGKKENVWSDKNVFIAPNLDGKVIKPVKKNSETLEALYQNVSFQDDKKKTLSQNTGKCAAVYRFNTMLTIAQYHNDKYIREVMRAQINRVGAAFEFLETDVLPKTGVQGFQKRDLKGEWEKYLIEHHKKVLGNLWDTLDGKIKVFEEKTGLTILKRWDYAGVFKRAGSKVDCGFEKSDSKMKARVKLLTDAFPKLMPPKSFSELKLT